MGSIYPTWSDSGILSAKRHGPAWYFGIAVVGLYACAIGVRSIHPEPFAAPSAQGQAGATSGAAAIDATGTAPTVAVAPPMKSISALEPPIEAIALPRAKPGALAGRIEPLPKTDGRAEASASPDEAQPASPAGETTVATETKPRAAARKRSSTSSAYADERRAYMRQWDSGFGMWGGFDNRSYGRAGRSPYFTRSY
jgi:hypothetical protein